MILAQPAQNQQAAPVPVKGEMSAKSAPDNDAEFLTALSEDTSDEDTLETDDAMKDTDLEEFAALLDPPSKALSSDFDKALFGVGQTDVKNTDSKPPLNTGVERPLLVEASNEVADRGPNPTFDLTVPSVRKPAAGDASGEPAFEQEDMTNSLPNSRDVSFPDTAELTNTAPAETINDRAEMESPPLAGGSEIGKKITSESTQAVNVQAKTIPASSITSTAETSISAAFKHGSSLESKPSVDRNILPVETQDKETLHTQPSQNIATTNVTGPAPIAPTTSQPPAFVSQTGSAFEQKRVDHLEDQSIEEKIGELGHSQPTSTTPNSAVTSAVATVKTATPTVVQQIAAALAKSSGQSTQIALNPEELGRVRISLSTNEAGIVVNIVAERPETADLMRRNIDSLLQDFSELGYDNPTFDFQSGDNHDDDDASDSSPNSADSVTIDTPQTQLPTTSSLKSALGGLDLKL